MTINIAINGYGRIGRDLHRQLIGHPNIKVKAINSRADAESHAHLLKYDSLYGTLQADISSTEGLLKVNGDETKVLQIEEPVDLPWGELGIDVVIESTGKFTKKDEAACHLTAGAKRVLITAPCKDKDVETIVMGVNENSFNPSEDKIVSNASCTTNCLAPVMKALHDAFKVEQAFVTTIHALTHTQNLLDNSHKDPRRARATNSSIIPTTTGAMKAIGQVIPDLDGKIDGMAFRVPVQTGSCVDIVAKLSKEVTVEELNDMFRAAAKANPEVFGVSEEPLVSIDYKGDTHSTTVDLLSTKVMNNGFVKIIAWYDNEWGYVARVLDLIEWITK
ncbi:MAG: type I glyceraldehyde-3-phosphate dehydrogenase [Candidatus Peregrinibacteria bacterium]|nr:type I glyceraldehyde-3-phosphate dehydrogenase [Candidatus Peregrinibacteria bacterium]MDZ4244993.1 type I glyceraldehyde-3-phosphate dehydrogenase [Candidatus Gracilibacteria bacterium]